MKHQLTELIRVVGVHNYKTTFFCDGKLRLRLLREYEWANDEESLTQLGEGVQTQNLGEGGDWTLLSETRYIYDGMRVIQERDGNNTPTVTYTRGTVLKGTLEGAGGIGGLLARSHGYSSGNWTSHAYYHGNGNITMLVDANEASVAAYRYDPYGNTLSSSGSLAAANTYRFSSKEIEPASGLYYYGYRWYSPPMQRWLNRDPIAELGGANLYGFVANSPLVFADIHGLGAGIQSRRPLQFQNQLAIQSPSQNLQVHHSEGHLLVVVTVVLVNSTWNGAIGAMPGPAMILGWAGCEMLPVTNATRNANSVVVGRSTSVQSRETATRKAQVPHGHLEGNSRAVENQLGRHLGNIEL